MKKTYQHPEIEVVKISTVSLLMVSGEGLDGFDGYGGGGSGKEAGARGEYFDENEEDY